MNDTLMRMMYVCVVVVGVCLLQGNMALAQTTTPPSSTAQPFIYTGAGSCASSNCHGSVTPQSLPNIEIRQNEHFLWLKQDKHARAYEVLHKPRSVRMAEMLQLTEGAHKSPKCLTCHALSIPQTQQGPYYQVEDGVSCEACHGPAESWLGTHITRSYKASLQVGMYDTKNLLKRAEKCVSCHVGDAPDRHVDHAMIAAGHPDLLFELDTFTTLMPPHWRDPQKAWSGVQAWSIGQAVALRESAKRLARRAQQHAAPGWPEFAEFDCYACHHEVRNTASTYYVRSEHGMLKAGGEWQASWRQARGYTGVAGIPAWDASQYMVFRHLVGIIAPEARSTLDQELATLAKRMQKVAATDPQQVSEAALRVAQTVEPLIPQVAQIKFDAELIKTLLSNITADGAALAHASIRVAEQAAMAIDTLFIAYKMHTKSTDTKPIDEAIQQLFALLEKPEHYEAQPFSRHMQTVHGFFTKQ